jgi:mono/diheme cytochrome c family protein
MLDMNGFRTLGYLSIGVAAACIVGAPAHAADPRNGERLAHRWCEACHVVVVAKAQRPSTTDQAPPFASIANEPGFSASKIALFLLDPHPKMPDMSLSRKEAEDLAAYIATLK